MVFAPNPIAVALGFAYLLFFLSMYVAAVIGVAAGIAARRRSRPGAARLARRVGAISFLLAFTWILFYSHASYDSPGPPIVAHVPLAVLGLIAWWLGITPGHVSELKLFVAVPISCAIVATGLIRHDDDYRQRRDTLFAAAKNGDSKQVRRLLATGLSPNLTNERKTPLLEMASNAESAQALFDAGANIKAAPHALAWAAKRRNAPLVKVMLAHGAAPDSTDGTYTAATHAFWNKDLDTLELLRLAGAKDAARYQRLTGALIKAVEARDEGAVREVLAGEYLRAERDDGLRLAAERGDTAIAVMLARKIDEYAVVGRAMLIAARSNHPDTFGALVDELDRRPAGFEIDQMKAQALAIARANRFPDIERIVMARGAESQRGTALTSRVSAAGVIAALAEDTLVVYEKIGCLDGIDDALTIHKNGSAELIDRRARRPAETSNRRHTRVAPARLALLESRLRQTDFAGLDLQYQTVSADVCVSRVTARTRAGKSRTVTTMDVLNRSVVREDVLTTPAPEFLLRLIEELEALRAQVR